MYLFIYILGTTTQNAPVDNVTNLVTALTAPMIYGDERDAIIAKWNQLQASWGTGKGYFSPNAPPVEFTPENPFCCFKVAVLYGEISLILYDFLNHQNYFVIFI